MRKEREYGDTQWRKWQTKGGREFQQLIGKDGIAPSELLRISQSPVGEAREQTKAVLENGWRIMSEVLSKGGIATGQGKVFQGIQTNIDIPPLLAQDLSYKKLFTARRLQFEEEYFIDLSEFTSQLAEHVSFIMPGLQEHMYIWHRHGGPALIETGDGNGKSTEPLLRSFRNMFANLYQEENIPEIVAPHSAALSMLEHIAMENGLGVKRDIDPDWLYKPAR